MKMKEVCDFIRAVSYYRDWEFMFEVEEALGFQVDTGYEYEMLNKSFYKGYSGKNQELKEGNRPEGNIDFDRTVAIKKDYPLADGLYNFTIYHPEGNVIIEELRPEEVEDKLSELKKVNNFDGKECFLIAIKDEKIWEVKDFEDESP